MPEVSVEDALQTATALHQSGQFDEAEAICRDVLATQPGQPMALHLLGKILFSVGQVSAGVELIKQAIAVEPDQAEYHLSLGVLLANQGNVEQAIESCRQALKLSPDYAQAHYILGNLMRTAGRLEDATAAYEQAIFIRPAFGGAYHNLGGVLQDQGRFAEACDWYQKVIALGDDVARGYLNLGTAFYRGGRFDEAIASFEHVLSLKPDHVNALMNLGSAFKNVGRVDDAVACDRRVLALQPDSIVAHDNLLLALQYDPESDPQSLQVENQRWNQQHAQPLLNYIEIRTNDRTLTRRLRIGYVSPDFFNHPVAWFMLPLLERHDRSAFEIICYSQRRVGDDMTGKLKAAVPIWRDIARLSDEEVAAAVRADGIDILVNLALHSAKNRLLVFARKPAPVQVAYLGYAGGTALGAMDYRLTDQYLDPDPAEDQFYMEKTVRLPGTYWCYRPTLEMPGVNDLPAATAGHITFCSLNNFSKVNNLVLQAWSDLLGTVADSRLLLHCPSGQHRNRLLEFMETRGIVRHRVELLDRHSRSYYLRIYHRADIALDPFPFCGGTTTCDALWMGVPVVSRVGKTPVSRAGSSILTHAGLPQLVARSAQEYVKLAAELAADLPRLANLRATLRRQMQNSLLMDEAKYVADIEGVYQSMWRTYTHS